MSERPVLSRRMLLFLAGAVLLAVYVIPGGWGYALVAVAALLVVGEGMLFRSMRGLAPAVGVEAMIGSPAVVVASCRPVGSVRYRRELWKARCNAGATSGDLVVIDAVERITLLVSPASEPRRSGE